MHKAIHIPRSKDKTSTKLKRIFAQTVLAMPGGLRALAGQGIVSAQDVQDGSALQLRGAIGPALLVNQQRELDPDFFPKLAGIIRIAQPNGCKRCASLSELLFKGAQLRDMLAAEDSAVMTQKDDHSRTARPQRAEPHLLAGRIRQSDSRQPAAE